MNPLAIYSHPSFDLLCHGKTEKGLAFGQAVKTHTIFFTLAYFKENTTDWSKQIVSIIAIPRGGMETAFGVRDAFSTAFDSNTIQVIISQCKTKQKDLYPKETFEKTTSLVFADGIVATGKTIIDHLDDVPLGWKGTITVFANAAAKKGVEAISSYALSMNRQVQIVVGHLFNDEECDWINVEGKDVYLVGTNKAHSVDYQLPNFGDYLSE